MPRYRLTRGGYTVHGTDTLYSVDPKDRLRTAAIHQDLAAHAGVPVTATVLQYQDPDGRHWVTLDTEGLAR